MTEQVQPTPCEEAGELAKTQKVHEQQAYSIASLRAHCTHLFGVMPEVFDGALYGVREAELTKQEVNQKIQAFLQREVP